MGERKLFDCRVPGLKGKLFRAYAGLSTADYRKDRSVQELVKTITGQPSKQEKLIAGINLVGKILPGTEEMIGSKITNTDQLPFTGIKDDFLLGNGENIIFLQDDPEKHTPNNVIKVNKVVFGCDGQQLQEAARVASREFQTIKSWFENTGLVIPDEQIIITHSHLRKPSSIIGNDSKSTNNIPTMVTIQEFIPGEFEGIFENFTIDSLKQRLSKNTKLLEQWGLISSIIINTFESEGRTPDILGVDNFSINKKGCGKLSLVHIDPHLILTRDLVRNWKLEDDFNKRLEFLRESSVHFSN